MNRVAPPSPARAALALLSCLALASPAAVADTDEGIVLSLEQAIELSLLGNLDVEAADIDRRISRAGAEVPRGAFDPVMTLFYRHGRNVQATGTTLDAATSVNISDTFDAAVTQKLPYGATWEVSVGSTRQESNNPFVTLSPSYSSDLLLRYTQPLLKGLGRDANMRDLRRALNQAEAAEKSFRIRARDAVRDTIDAYWELVFAREDLEVKQASLELAENLLRQNRIMVEVGTMAPLELAEAEAAVAERRQDIIAGRSAIGNAADALRRLLGIEEDSPWWGVPIVPADEPRFHAAWVDLGESLELALANREELANAELDLANARLDLEFSRDALRPSLDLEVTLSTAGLAGDQRDFVDLDGDTVPETSVRLTDQWFEDSFEQIADRRFNSWTASLVYTRPLWNRAARANFLTSRLGLERRVLGLEQARQGIILEVRRAVRDVESARERVVATQANRELQEKKLDAEIKKFENGLSTNFLVLQFQTDLTTARSAELRSVIDYLKALAALERARGSLLEESMLTLARR